MRAALRARPLLEQHELAALEVDTALGEHRQHLEGEEDLAVEILVQRVPVTRAVAEDQWRGASLPGVLAALEQLFAFERKRLVLATEKVRPGVGNRCEVTVEGRSERFD